MRLAAVAKQLGATALLGSFQGASLRVIPQNVSQNHYPATEFMVAVIAASMLITGTTEEKAVSIDCKRIYMLSKIGFVSCF